MGRTSPGNLPTTRERSHQVRTALTIERYLAGGLGADRGRLCPAHAVSMFAFPGVATATVWVNSHIAQATKPGPLELIGGWT
jgi:hypothetical protein